MMLRRVLFTVGLLALQACGGLGPAIVSNEQPANLLLNNSESVLSFVSIKNSSIGEVHRFNGLSGFLAEKDQVTIGVDLATVSTGIEIRDQRMAEHLFDVTAFSTATITVNITEFALEELSPGDTLKAEVAVGLNLHGVDSTVPASVSVVRLENGGLLVQSNKPIVLNTAAFGLTAGIAKLAELAALSSIAAAVPVSFSLVFDRV